MQKRFYDIYLIFLSGAADFDAINATNNPLVAFTSDSSTHRQCFNVTIIDDQELEISERFSLNLNLSQVTGHTLNITVFPDVSIVEITDEDGMWTLLIIAM